MPMNQVPSTTRFTSRKSLDFRHAGTEPDHRRPTALAGLIGAALALVAAGAVYAQTDPTLTLGTTDEADIRLKDDAPITIDPFTGALQITPFDPALTCGSGSCDDVNVQILDFQPSGTIEAFTTQEVPLTWNTRGAWECRGAGSGLAPAGWTTTSFDQPPTRTSANPFILDLSTLDLAGSEEVAFDLTLECRNGSVVDAVTRDLIVRTVTSTSCDGRDAPALLTQDLQLIRDDDTTTRTWASVFGAPFPDGSTATRDGRIENRQYVSLSLNTVDVAPGRLGTFVFQDTTTSRDADVGNVVWSISRCLGDFGPAVPDSCRGMAKPGGIPSNFRWQIGGTSFSRCVMEPDAQYFINLVPAIAVPEGQDVDWNCAGSSSINACEFLFRKLDE